MPFKSQAQRRYLYAKHPEVAEEFAKKTSDIKNLPEYKESPVKKELRKRLRK